jgi:MFS family permease
VTSAAAERGTRLQRTLRAFHNYNFRLFWFGQLVSQCGTWMQSVAQAWLVLQIAHSPVALGTVTALQFLPITLGSFFASLLVDRLPKRRLLLITQSAALTQATILAVLALSGHIQLWHVYLLALFLGCVNALDAPTRQSFVMDLVGRETLVNAVGLNSAIMNSARLFGPALGGIVIAAWGVSVCFTLNAVSFLAVLVALTLMRPAEFHTTAPRAKPPGRVFAELAEGVRFVWGDPELAGLIIVLAGLGIFGFNYSTMIPLFATDGLQLGPEGFGLLSAGVGVGALAAAVGLAGSGRPSYRAILIAAVTFSLLLSAASLAQWFPLAWLLVAAFSFTASLFTMSSNSTLQLRAPDALRGRVMGLYTTLVMGATPLGALLTGFLAKVAGIRLTMFTWGGVCLLATVLGFLLSQRRARIAPVLNSQFSIPK